MDSVDTDSMVVRRLMWVDYMVFASMLIISAAIGIFFGCFGSKNKTSSDFLMGKRSMPMFPVLMSLFVSFMSANGLLGIPANVYQNGVTYYISGLSFFFVMPTVAYVYLPVFWNLQITSTNEYLEKRFNKPTRLLGSVIFILQMSFFMGISVYAPALALAQVTGLHVYVSIVSVCVVCIFYSTLGGIKAVMWTDVLQATVLYGSMFFIIIKGTIGLGGFASIMEATKRGGRDNLFVFDFSLTTNFTFWSVFFGAYFMFLSLYGVNQTIVQRYMTLGKKSQAVKCIWLNIIGLFTLKTLSVYSGLLIYAKYEKCDPITSNLIASPDQLLPYFAMEILQNFNGLPGLFVAGVFSAALSTISSGINSLAAIALEDFTKKYFAKMSKRKEINVTRLFNFYFGVQTLALAFLAEQMGSLLSAVLSLFGILGGPMIGLFTLGMIVPMANSAGAFFGTLISLALMLWIGMGHQMAVRTGAIVSTGLPLTACPNSTTLVLSNSTLSRDILYETFTTETTFIEENRDDDFLIQIYKLSNMWYSVFGFVILLFAGIIISLLTGRNNKRKLNPKLLSPFVTWFKCLYPGYDTIGLDFVEKETELNQYK